MALLLKSALVPAAVSIVIAISILRGSSHDTLRRFAGALAYAISFFVGYALLETRALRPTTYWHYLPWLALVAAGVGPIRQEAGYRSGQRLALLLTVSMAASWWLVPTWASLQQARIWYVAALAGTFLLFWSLLDPLAGRTPRGWLTGALALSALNAGVLVAAFVSIRFGLLSIVTAAALGGPCLAAFIAKQDGGFRGVLPLHVVVFGGVMLAAGLSVGLPSSVLILNSAAPLGLWLCADGPLSRLPGKWRCVVAAGIVCLPLAAAWGISLAAQQAEPTW